MRQPTPSWWPKVRLCFKHPLFPLCISKINILFFLILLWQVVMVTPLQDSHHMVSHDRFSQNKNLIVWTFGNCYNWTFLPMVFHMNEAVILIFIEMGSQKLKCCLNAMEQEEKYYLYQHYPSQCFQITFPLWAITMSL